MVCPTHGQGHVREAVGNAGKYGVSPADKRSQVVGWVKSFPSE